MNGAPLRGADTREPPRSASVAGSSQARRLSSSGCGGAVSSRARPPQRAPPPEELSARAARMTPSLGERLDGADRRGCAWNRGSGGASCSSWLVMNVPPAACFSVCSAVPLVLCCVRAHAAHGEGRARATRAVPYAAAGRSEGGLQGWQGTRQLLIHSNIRLAGHRLSRKGVGPSFLCCFDVAQRWIFHLLSPSYR